VSQQLFDFSGDLLGLTDRDIYFKLPTGREMNSLMAAVLIRETGPSRCRSRATSSSEICT